MRSLKKIHTILIVTVSLWLAFTGFVYGDVTTAESQTGRADTVYVAGNPDAYPIEYYDSEAGEYKGLIPKLLEEISEETGISFTYVSAGKYNVQSDLARNKQVDMVTAITSKGIKACRLTDDLSTRVITTKEKGHTKTYYIGFTDIADKKEAASIKAALSKITEEEKTGILLSIANEGRGFSSRTLYVYAALAFAVAAVAVAVLALFISKKRRKEEERIELVDPETGLGNARYYQYIFDNFIGDGRRNIYNGAYFSFDGERVENLWGEHIRKGIQGIAAEYLNSITEKDEYISRVDKDSFVLLFTGGNHEESYNRARKMITGLTEKLTSSNAQWRNLFHEGVCYLSQYPDSGSEAFLYNMRQAYLHAEDKELSFYLGSGKQTRDKRKREKLCRQLNDSIEKGEFELYMQFIAESSGGNICGAEVLSRWQNREYGLLKPNEYIELLRETGNILEHDFYIFEQVCRLLEKWNEPPYEHLFLTCNSTRTSASKEGFADRIREIAEKYTFDRGRLILEVTEDSVAGDEECINENIKEIRNLGFNVAIDDMGAGFSALADLYDNEIEIVKLERELLVTCKNARQKQMLRDLILMIHDLGARVICEGVETKKQMDFMASLDCDFLQGYYFSRPLPSDQWDNFLASKPTVSALPLRSLKES